MFDKQIRRGRVSACTTLFGMASETVQAVDHELLAAGEWRSTGEWAEVRSPYDGSVVGRVAQGDAGLVDRAARAAQEAFETAD